MHYASGEIFTIDIEAGVAICRLFKRPESTPASLLRGATQLLSHARALTLSGTAKGLVLDVRRFGNRPAAELMPTFGDILEAWENTAQKVSVLVLEGTEQRLSFFSIVADKAPRFAEIHSDRNEARKYVGIDVRGEPNTVSKVVDLPKRA